MRNKEGRKKGEDKQNVENSMSFLLPKIFFIIVLSGFILVSWFFVDWLYQPDRFPIKQVKMVNQLKNQESKELQLIASRAIKGGFFSLDIDRFRTELLQNLPWVKAVTVRKVWPDSVLVSIREHQPVGRWLSIENIQKDLSSSQNEMELLSRDGIVFSPELSEKQRKKFKGLAILTGPEMSTKNILETCFSINENLKPLKIRVKQCGMNGRRSWLITLKNGIIIKLGKDNVMQNLTQYIDVFSGQLSQYFEKIDYADLRFSNGFSVKWKVETNDRNKQDI